MLEYKNPICIRGTHLNCPLPLTLESYWACEADCLHCMGRRMNQIWGHEQRAVDPVNVRRKLVNSQKVKNPKTPLAVAMYLKKTIWIGRKSDPYQPIELELGITRSSIETLIDLQWSFVLCSRYMDNAMRDESLLLKAGGLVTFLVEVTPGGESDWELFERKRTTRVEKRLRIAKRWADRGIHVGVRGEPFIPGHHTTSQFRDTLRLLRSFGLKSYNTYNLHINEYTIKRLHAIDLDIEKIWECNQDKYWRPLQRELCQIADEEGIALGCPDFVNVPKGWGSSTNTCCGVDVPQPFTFNTHHWRQLLQQGVSAEGLFQKTWEGIGTEDDKNLAHLITCGKSKDHYTMRDSEL